MGHQAPHHVLTGAIVLSLAAHGGLALFASRIGIGAEPGAEARFETGPAMLLDWEEPPPPMPPEPERAEPKPEEAAQPEPEVFEEEITPFRLGIAKSSLDTENWIGFADPTPHEAPKADVEQPALDPGASATAPAAREAADTGPNAIGQPPSRPPGVAAPPPPTVESRPALPQLPMPNPATEPPPAAEQQDPRDKPPTDGDKNAADDQDQPGFTEQSEAPGAPQPEVEDPELPMMKSSPEESDALERELTQGFVGPPFIESELNAEGETPVEQRPLETSPNPASIPPMPEGDPNSPATVGANGGGTPGQQSERESDATSLRDPVQVRLGKPAAAEGLEIITKRPEWSLITRATSMPSRNPRLKVTFNREGRVSTAHFLESTGFENIDAPVLHAVYRWIARGEALKAIPANDEKAGLSITVTILLR